MSYSIGKKFIITTFGESHQNAVGVTIEGLPAGAKYPSDLISTQLKKRAPGQKGTTPRKEADEPKVLCGVLNDVFTGSALTAIFENTNIRSNDYPFMFRPSHSDYPAFVKYNGHNDRRGGGQFSGRLTLPIVYAGAIAQSLLETLNISVDVHLTGVGPLKFPRGSYEDEIPSVVYDYLSKLNGDSVGAKIECMITGVPCGLGEPLYDSIESKLSHFLFSIPGLKGVTFGDALDMAKGFGSEMNDLYYKENNQIKTKTNHNGGILGGLSTGMPIVFETYFKPTSSIGIAQETYDPQTDEMETLEIKGRHDPCIGIRALPVVQAVSAIVIYDLLLEQYGSYRHILEELGCQI